MQFPHQQPEPPSPQPAPEDPTSERDESPPVYRKPTLRRYDQIEQVRPYGPSERKAG